MSYKTSVQDTYYSQFTNDEKIAYALNLSLAKITIDSFKSNYEWYKSPDLFNAIKKESILSEPTPRYDDIKDYYCIITVGTVEYITNITVNSLLTHRGGFILSDILGTHADILTGPDNENSSAPVPDDFDSNGLCKKLPRQAFAYFVYWREKLTGKGNGTTNGSVGSGAWPIADDSLSLKLTLNSDGTNNSTRIYSKVITDQTLMEKLETYVPIKIIDNVRVDNHVNDTGKITQTTIGIPTALKPYILKNVVINVAVPTVSTWNGL